MVNREGAEHSTFVIDSQKIVCPFCNGTQMFLSNLMDDPNDITEDTVFSAIGITAAGSPIMGLVALCKQCGHTHVPLWYFYDVSATTTTALIMTNLDASVANGLAGAFAICLVGTDQYKYVIIASNTAATPTTLTVAFALNNDADGLFMITNVEPIGLTRIVA